MCKTVTGEWAKSTIKESTIILIHHSKLAMMLQSCLYYNHDSKIPTVYLSTHMQIMHVSQARGSKTSITCMQDNFTSITHYSRLLAL